MVSNSPPEISIPNTNDALQSIVDRLELNGGGIVITPEILNQIEKQGTAFRLTVHEPLLNPSGTVPNSDRSDPRVSAWTVFMVR